MAFEIENGVLKRYTEEDGVTEVVIPDGVKKIRALAFYQCENLTNIHIPDSITEIEEAAFEDCQNLTSIDIPNCVTEIKYFTFAGCEKLTSINIPDSVTKIEWNAFMSCKNLMNINIPDSVKYIEFKAFCHCNCLTNVHLPEHIAHIGKFAFSDCEKLKTIFIPIPVSGNGEKVEISLVPENSSDHVHLMEQIQMLRTKNFSVEMKTEVKYLLLCRFLVLCPEMPELVAYMKEHFEEILEFAIENNFIEAILIFISWNLLNQGNIDGFIQLAIDNTQKSGNPEIQLLLIEYKYKHIEFTSIEDKFKL